MSAARIPEGVIRQILRDERSPVRFEHFCCSLLSEVEGVEYLPTSRSYDRARDGRDTVAAGECRLVCCGLEGNFEAKAKSDLGHTLKHSKPTRVSFCTPIEKSEQHLDRVKEALSNVVKGVEIIALGGYQIVELVRRHPKPFEQRYAAELLEHREFLSAGGGSDETLQIMGMHVALTTQLEGDALEMRARLLDNLILGALIDRAPRTVRALAKLGRVP